MKQKYPHLLRVQNQSKPEVEVNLKENLKVTDKTHQKTKRQMNHTLMITLIIIIIMTIKVPQVKIEAADLLLVNMVADNLEASHNEAEARDLSTININKNYKSHIGVYTTQLQLKVTKFQKTWTFRLCHMQCISPATQTQSQRSITYHIKQ